MGRFRLQPSRTSVGACGVALLVVAEGAIGPASAGPPFRTDDPEPVDTRHWEINLFSAGTLTRDTTSGTVAGIDANYGLAANLQVHSTVFLGYSANAGETTQIGLGDWEIGAKYRILEPNENAWWPQLAVYPLIDVPTGNASLGFGTSHMQVFLPAWLQKDFDVWTVYGGGGYWFNPGAGNRNYWFTGAVLERKIDDQLTVGIELFHQTSNARGLPDSTGYNLGAIYEFSEHFHLLVSAGNGLQNITATNKFSYYAGLQINF